jgi:hypothetical protein
MIDHNLTTETGVVVLMKSSATPTEWNANCDKVKAANGGNYPPFWFQAVVLSGIAARTLKAC